MVKKWRCFKCGIDNDTWYKIYYEKGALMRLVEGTWLSICEGCGKCRTCSERAMKKSCEAKTEKSVSGINMVTT